MKRFGWMLLLMLSLAFTVRAEEAVNPLAVGIGTFETDLDGWEFSIGKEYPGAQGNAAQTTKYSHSGVGAAWVEGAFGAGGAYVAVAKNLAEKIEAKEIRFFVKTDGMAKIRLRLRASDNQTHQQIIPLQKVDGWQEIVVTDFAPKGKPGYLNWGGEKDGVWRGPLCAVSIIVDRGDIENKETKTGQLWLDDITLIKTAE